MQVRDHAVAAALDELAGRAAVGAVGPPPPFLGYPARKRYTVTMPVVIGFLRFQKRSLSVFVCNDLVLP